MLSNNPDVATAVGAKLLEWRGAEVLEFMYLLQEKNALETLRVISKLSPNDKKNLISFLKKMPSGKKIVLRGIDCSISHADSA